MSSSASEAGSWLRPGAPFPAFVEASLEAIAAEAPAAHRVLTSTLSGRCIALTVDGEYVTLRFGEGRVFIDSEPTPADAWLTTSRAAIFALVDGEHSLETALDSGGLDIVAEVDALLVCLDGLAAYFAGAVRAPSMAVLLAVFRDSSSPQPGTTTPRTGVGSSAVGSHDSHRPSRQRG